MAVLRSALFLLICVLLVPVPSQAQKKRKDKKNNDARNEQVLLAEAELIEGMRYYIQDNYERALQQILKGIRINPQSSGLYYQAAVTLSKMDKNEEALVYVEKALSLDRQNPYYYILKAHLQSALFRYKEAAQTYETLLAHFPSYSYYALDLGLLYEEQLNNPEKALAAYRKLLEEVGETNEVLTRMQRLYLRQGEYVEAFRIALRRLDQRGSDLSPYLPFIELIENAPLPQVESLNRAIANDPMLKTHPASQLVWALGLYRLEQKKDSQRLLQNVIEHPFTNNALREVAVLSYVRLFKNEADLGFLMKYLAELCRKNPYNTDLLNQYGIVLQKRYRYAEAAQVFLQSLETQQSQIEIWLRLFDCLEKAGQYQLFYTKTQEGIELYPFQGIIWMHHATACLYGQRTAEAAKAIERARQLTSDNQDFLLPEIERIEALIQAKEGKIGDAIEKMEKLLRKQGESPQLLYDYCLLLASHKQKLDYARNLSEKLLKLADSSPLAQYTHGRVLYSLRLYTEALPYLKQAAEQLPTAYTLESYGDVLFRLGKTEEAVELWQKALKLSEIPERLKKKIDEKGLYED
jgi:tetratricopeptide (TPR) repeat protein